MFRAFVSFVVVVGLASCGGGGGGGGGGGSAPLGTTAANLDNSNVGGFATVAALATRLGAGTRFGPLLNIPANPPGALQQTGCMAGTATFVVTPSTGTVSGSATYSNFDNCYFLPLNGTASVTGTLIGTNQVDSFTLTFSGFAYGGTSEIASGTIVLTWKPSFQGSAGYIMTINATVSDANGNPLFRLDNFQIDSDLSAGLESVLVSGRLTTSQGFVDLSSTNRLQLPSPSAGFQSGALAMTGLSQIATVTYSGGNGAFTAVIAPNP
jgi:hypothetical protein